MVSLLSLWLPILLSAVIVFVVSSVIHMLLPYHRSDYIPVPEEDATMEAMGKFNIPPGDYVVPYAGSTKALNSPEYKEKLERGPVLFMTVLKKGPQNMGLSLFLWFCYGLLVSVFAAYISSRALEPGARFLAVFRFAGATAFAGYGLALLQNSIWYRRNWCATFKSIFDGLVYALATGAVFAWLWPAITL